MSRYPRPARVLHVMNGASGGAAESTLDLIAAFAARGITSSAVCDARGGTEDLDRLRDAVEGRLTVTPLVWWNKKTRAAWWKRPLIAARQAWLTRFGKRSAQAVTAAALEYAAQLIHTNTLLTPEGGLASRLIGVPHVWHVRELVGTGQPFRFPVEGPALITLMQQRADAVICNSAVTARQLTTGFAAGSFVRVVPNGLDIAKFAGRERKWGEGGVTVAMVGSLTSRWKKHELFLRAAARVRNPAVQYLLFGAGTNPDPAKEDGYVRGLRALAARLGLAERVRFLGFERDQVAMFNAFDILAHPADGESFGRIGVEAMAAGVPAIVPARGGLADIVKNGVTGIHVPPDDADALAAAIGSLVGDPARAQRLGARGREAATAYTREACAESVLQVYDEVAERRAIRGELK